MTDNKRFTSNNGVFYTDNYTGWEFQSYGEVVELMNNLNNENEKLKSINKGQELEIVRLHKLADAMSGVLRKLGIYDVYDKKQIEDVKITIEHGERMRTVI